MVSGGVPDLPGLWGGVCAWVAAYAVWLWVLLGLAALVGVCVFRWWRRHLDRALSDRISVELVPATRFEPSEDEVEWFAGQLAQVREAAGAQLRRGAAVRVRLVCERGQLVYRLEGPRRAEALLRMTSYPDVEVVDPSAGVFEVPRIRFETAPPVRVAAGNGGAQ